MKRRSLLATVATCSLVLGAAPNVMARSATTRATMSVVPPGANGTTSRTGLVG